MIVSKTCVQITEREEKEDPGAVDAVLKRMEEAEAKQGTSSEDEEAVEAMPKPKVIQKEPPKVSSKLTIEQQKKLDAQVSVMLCKYPLFQATNSFSSLHNNFSFITLSFSAETC